MGFHLPKIKLKDLDVFHKGKKEVERFNKRAGAEVERTKDRVQKEYDRFEDRVKAEAKRFDDRVEAELERIPDNIKKLGNKVEEEYKRLLRKGRKQIDKQLERYRDKFLALASQYLGEAERTGAADPLKAVEARMMPIIKGFVRPIVQQIVKLLSEYVATIPYIGPVIAGLMMTAGVEQLTVYASESLWSALLKQLGVKQETKIEAPISLNIVGDQMIETAVGAVKNFDASFSEKTKDTIGAFTQSIEGLRETAESVRADVIAAAAEELQNAMAKIKIDPNLSIKTLQSAMGPKLAKELEPYLDELLAYTLAPLEDVAIIGKEGMRSVLASAKESLDKHLLSVMVNQQL